MSAATVLQKAGAHGLTLWVEGERLRYRGEADAVQALLPELAANKAELLVLLQPAPPSAPGPAPAPANDPAPAPPAKGWNSTQLTGSANPKAKPASARPLNDAALAALVISTALAHGVDPTDAWFWLDQGDIEALRAGDEAHIQAFPVALASAVALGQLTPSGHAITPPFRPRAMGETERHVVTCGGCAHFLPDRVGDGRGIGGCAVGGPATPARYPNVPRVCRAFKAARPPPEPTQDRTPTEPDRDPNPLFISVCEDADMGLTLTDSGDSFELAPAGTYAARCFKILDLGTQRVTWQGSETSAKKILLMWELADPDARMSDGRPFIISKRYTASLNEKSALRKDLESWRGRPFTPEELRSFDVAKLLGQPCMMSILHVDKAGRTFANISALMKLPRGLPLTEAANEPVAWDFDKPDWDVFEKLSPRLQEVLTSTPEYARIPNGPKAPPANTAPSTTPAPARHAPPPVAGWEHLPPASRPSALAPPPAPAPAGGVEDFDGDIPF
ncbi:phage replication initiation protein, NGO0469 family [Methylomagnum sp.]